MSISHINWALQQTGLSGAEKSTLICLCNALDNDGGWYMKQKTLSEMSGNSRQTVNSHLRKFVDMFSLEVTPTRRSDGRQGYNHYRLTISDETRVKQDDTVKNQSQPVQVQSQADSVPESGSLTAITTQNSPITHPERNARAEKRKTQIPPEWAVSDELRAWANEKHPTVNLAREGAQFRDHHMARGTTFVDWGRAFQTWVRNAEEFSSRGNGTAHQRPQEARQMDLPPT